MSVKLYAALTQLEQAPVSIRRCPAALVKPTKKSTSEHEMP